MSVGIQANRIMMNVGFIIELTEVLPIRAPSVFGNNSAPEGTAG